MKNIRFNIFTLAVVFYFLNGLTLYLHAQAMVGESFPSWTEGYLDIHHINTGKGESSFFILPDGTTMLVDAGATARPKPRVTDQKPDSSRTPGEWISRYILHMMKTLPEKKLNYILLTHFHDDHIGGLKPGLKSSASGTFRLTGVTEVGENIPFSKLIDRGYPDYNWPRPLDDDNMKNYLQFQKWYIRNKGLVVEKFQPGQNKQLVLMNDRDKYPDFEIRNIAVNGHIWTGFGVNERNNFPLLANLTPAIYPDENKCCIVFRLSYGKFDYFNGADITAGPSGEWQDVETPVALVTGPVEVCEANHHAYYDAMSLSFIQTVRPRVFIIQTWSPSHPSVSVLSRMLSQSVYPGPRDIFATNIMEVTKVVIGESLDNLKSQQGHIVVRVSPGGNSFMVYILDDSKESFLIKAVHGPYLCN